MLPLTLPEKSAICAAYEAMMTYRETARSYGLDPCTALDDKLFLAIFGMPGPKSFLYDIRNKTCEEIRQFLAVRLLDLKDSCKGRRKSIETQIADLQKELADLDAREESKGDENDD